MLDPDDLAEVSSTFAVAEQQVRRDHLIGHALAALQSVDLSTLVFFGGTALSWTHLPTGRLSEDIDLYVADRSAAAAVIDSTSRGCFAESSRELPGSRRWPQCGGPSLRVWSPATASSSASSSWMSNSRAGSTSLLKCDL